MGVKIKIFAIMSPGGQEICLGMDQRGAHQFVKGSIDRQQGRRLARVVTCVGLVEVESYSGLRKV